MSSPNFIDVAGRRTRVRVAGDPSAPPVLLLHGIGRSLEDWAAVFPLLAREYRVITLDLPGFGFSTRRPERATSTSFALGAMETLDALGESRPVHVVGNSLGGAIALQLQAIASERVESLVLVDAAGFGPEVISMLRLLTVPVLAHLATARTTRFSAKLVEKVNYSDASLATAARIEHAVEISKQPDSGALMRETARALGTIRGVRSDWRQSLLETVALHPRPTLVVWGEHDRVLPVKHVQAARSGLPHADSHIFTGVGHMPQIECPDNFVDVVSRFLARVVAETEPEKCTQVNIRE